MAIKLTRRQSIGWALALTTMPATWAFGAARKPLLLSARDSLDGRHWAVGFDVGGQERFALPTPQRCHDILVHPRRTQALFIARRPGTQCYWVDTERGELVCILNARVQRHFYGHGVFDVDGNTLYLTENDLRQPGRGVIGIYALIDNRFEFRREISTHGIEPHQLEWLPGRQALITANGGMRTEANSREVLNPEAIDSSLVQVNLQGELISKDTLPHPWLSIRHLAVQPDGAVVVAQQYLGNLADVDERLPLLAVKKPGAPLVNVPLSAEQLQRMNGYLASIAVHPDKPLMATTAPRGNRFLVLDTRTLACLFDEFMPDCAGITAYRDGFILSSGQGRCRYLAVNAGRLSVTALPLPEGGWDNHLRLG